MRHVLITGAAGFIGGHAVKEFTNAGWDVAALVHKPMSLDLEERAADGSVTLVRGDLTDFDAVERKVQDVLAARNVALDVIVHCAGRVSDVGWRREFRRTNFEPVQRFVQMTKDLDIGRFVFVSTTDVYGLRDFHRETEDELPMSNNRRNPYPEFKIAAEKWIRNELPSTQFAIVRPAAVWGLGDPTLTPRIVKFLHRSPWTVHFGRWHGRNRWPLAHVHNVAVAIYLAATLQDAAGRAVNVLDNEFTSVDEFYRLLAGVFLPGKRLRTVTLPLWVGILSGSVVSAISNMFNLNVPFADPSLYAAYSVCCNLDFSNTLFQDLCIATNRHIVTRNEALSELHNSRDPKTQ